MKPMHIDGNTKVVGVFGSPISHTASPAMHNAAFHALGMNWVYLAFHVEPQNLRSALLGARDMGIVGINLTVPHKVLALDIVDEVDDAARRLGAVNTVHIKEGKLYGHNTDGYGIIRALAGDFNLSVKGKRVLVLGAGGAGRAVAVQCGLEQAGKVTIANRTRSKADDVIKELAPLKVEARSVPLTRAAVENELKSADLVINATSVGLKKGETLGFDARMFSPRLFVYDTIYRPAQTELLEAAEAAGAKVANGLSMLLHQGERAFEIWTDQKAPLAVMKRALRAAVYGEAA
jgi:shikimate dehydrogenase